MIWRNQTKNPFLVPFDGDYSSRSIRRHGTIREQIQVTIFSTNNDSVVLVCNVDNNRIGACYVLLKA